MVGSLPQAAWDAARRFTPAWYRRRLNWPADIASTIARLAAGCELAWLDSAAHGDGWSLVAFDPLARLECDRSGRATLSAADRWQTTGTGWDFLSRMLRQLPRWPAAPLGLAPGWVGYFAFETAGLLERLPAPRGEPPCDLPLIRLALFDSVVALDHHRREAWLLCALGLREAMGLVPVTPEDVARRWQAAAGTVGRVGSAPRLSWRPATRREHYLAAVRRALEYIAAGDIYQVNIAQRFDAPPPADPLALYAALRRANPAPYGALLRFDTRGVLSLSPELMLRKTGCEVLTSPIKGTRPRSGDPRRDAALREELLRSSKDRAELTMIVDLHRNDLGRVCRPGTVRVAAPRRVEAHPTVWHTVADVTGTLRDGCDALDLLAACLPAGSISGVPKLRAIEIINELEPGPRGVYTGAVGLLSLDGDLRLNVAIRTLQYDRRRACMFAGGGIVADSDPQLEYAETLDKAAALGRVHLRPRERGGAVQLARRGAVR